MHNLEVFMEKNKTQEIDSHPLAYTHVFIVLKSIVYIYNLQWHSSNYSYHLVYLIPSPTQSFSHSRIDSVYKRLTYWKPGSFNDKMLGHFMVKCSCYLEENWLISFFFRISYHLSIFLQFLWTIRCAANRLGLQRNPKIWEEIPKISENF